MKGKRILASFLCVVLLSGMIDTTALAAESYVTVSDSDIVTVSESVSGSDTVSNSETVSGNESMPGSDTVSGSDSVSDSDTVPDQDTISGSDFVSGNDSVSDNDTVSDSDIMTVSGNETLSPGDPEPEELPYTIDENGVLTSWENAADDIIIPNGVKAIGEGVFRGNSLITSVTLPEGVTVIGKNAFRNCAYLETLRLPKSLETIEESAFEGCKTLYMVYLKEPDYSKLSTLESRAFAGCERLEIFLSNAEFTLINSIVTIGDRAFEDCQKIKKATLPNKLESMGTGVFANCQYLKEITLSPNYSTIPAETFSGCYALHSIDWADTAVIGQNAFRNCEALKIIEIPWTVDKIEAGSFVGCSDLSFVTFKNDEIEFPTAGAVFSNTHTTTLCGNAGSTADIYAKGYSYLTFVTLANAKKTIYKINTSFITNERPELTVFCYTAQTVEDPEKPGETKVQITEVKEAKVGTKVYVEIQNIKTYAPIDGSIKANGVSLTADEQGYYFTQQPGGVYLTAEFVKKDFNENVGNITYEISEAVMNGDTAELKVGQTVYLYLYSDKLSLEKPLSGSRFTFEGYDKTKVRVSVDSQGRIRLTGLKATEATTIKVCSTVDGKKTTKLELPVKVIKNPLAKMDLHIAETSKNVKLEAPDEDGTKNVRVEVTALASSKGESLSLKVNGWDNTDTLLSMEYDWQTTDSTIAKLSKTTTPASDSSNEITIPKDAIGEATVTVRAKEYPDFKCSIHVMVTDSRPSLKVETTPFNINKEKPMIISLIESYGYTVDPNSLVLYDRKSDDKVAPSELFMIEPDVSAYGKYVIRTKKGVTVPNGTYKVSLDGETGGGTFSYIFNITVKNTIPSAKVKQTGKLNLFYSANGKEQKIQTTISGYGKEVIDHYALENLADTKGNETLQNDYNKFTENFGIDSVTGEIYRKVDTLGKYTTGSNKGKNVVTGYLAIYFKGYTTPTKVKITVPTETKKPSYILEKSSGTYNTAKMPATSQIVLPVFEKQGKTLTPVALSDGYEISYNFERSTGIFKTFTPSLSIVNGKILIDMKTVSGTGKIVLNLKNESLWGESALEFSYTVNVTSSLPKASLSKTKVTLNSLYDAQQDEFTLSVNQPDCSLKETQTFTPVLSRTNKEFNEAIQKISVVYENGKGIVSLPENETIKNGTYKFTCKVESQDEYATKTAITSTLNTITISVVVKNTIPSIKPKSATFTLNCLSKGLEVAKQPMTYSYAPAAGTGYVLDRVEIVKGEERFVTFEVVDNALHATLKDECPNLARNYSYTLQPVWKKGNLEVIGNKKTVTLKTVTSAPAVSLGNARGKLDLLNRDSGLTYSVSVKYMNDTLLNPKLYELDKAGQPSATESTNFKASVENGKLAIRAIDGAELKNGTNYKLQLRYELKTMPDMTYILSKVITVKPSQTFPKLTQDVTTVDLYQSNRDYYGTVTVSAKAGSTAQLTDVEWASNATQNMKDSFTYKVVAVDETTNSLTMNIYVNKNYKFAVGKTQTLPFSVICDGQDEATYGTKFSVKAAVHR